MRKSTLFHGWIAIAMLAGGLSCPLAADANDDFQALLADVQFTSADAADDLNAPMPPADVSADATVSAEAVPMAEPTPQAVTPMPQPVPADGSYGHHQYTSADSCQGACQQTDVCSCGHKHCPLISSPEHHSCTPYAVPQLPTSTFYQYFRSDACNTHVWDGYHNRCRDFPDLSLHPKPLCQHNQCGGHCGGGTDCGQIPAEWSHSGCDTCDAR